MGRVVLSTEWLNSETTTLKKQNPASSLADDHKRYLYYAELQEALSQHVM